MSKYIKIGHASISEKGTINGVAGDSTGKEVLIDPKNDITKKGYRVLLRPKTAELAEKTARACEAACLNDHIGYSQYNAYGAGRLTLYNEAKKVDFDLSKITNDCNTDCSAFMAVCAIAAGCDISKSVTTRTMVSAFEKSGDYEKKVDSIYFTSADYLKRGDILVREGSHTIMILENGSEIHENNTVSTILTNVNIIKIAVNIASITENTLKANAKITTIQNGVEVPLTDIGAYEWSYRLVPINDNGRGNINKKFKISSSNAEFSISGLTAGRSYKLSVSATAFGGNASFSSPNIIFTTAPNLLEKHSDLTFGNTATIAKLVNKVYIRVNNTFKRAIIHDDEVKPQALDNADVSL